MSLQSAESQFADMYKDCIMNVDLRLSVNKTSYKSDGGVDLFLESLTDSSVVFPSGFNIQIFKFENNEWHVEENEGQYLPLDAKYIIGKNDPVFEFDRKVIPIDPVVSTKTPLRVALYGHVYENQVETQKCSGAFVDIVVAP